MKSLHKVFVVSLLIALLLTACGPKEPVDHYAAIKEAGKIVFATSADFPPFEYVDESGKMTGFDVDLMNELGKEMGLEVEIQDMPFDSLIASVQEGKIDASVAAFNYSEERDEAVDFSEPYYYAEDGILVGEAFEGVITDPEEMGFYKVAAQIGSSQEAWIIENLVNTGLLPVDNLYGYERVDQAALDVKAGRVDLMLAEYVVTNTLAKQVGGLKVVYQGTVSNGPVSLVVPDGDTELVAAINEAIAKLLENGFVDGLVLKYMQ